MRELRTGLVLCALAIGACKGEAATTTAMTTTMATAPATSAGTVTIAGGVGGIGASSGSVVGPHRSFDNPGPDLPDPDFRADAERTIAPYRTRAKACFEKQLAKDPAAHGRVTVTLVVAGDGAAAVSIASSDAPKALSQCVLTTVTGIHFRPPLDGNAKTISVPFVFNAPR
ncbi:MAG: AgmX/PglI C-terminal domain-containing protein [Polyangiales bacterium]